VYKGPAPLQFLSTGEDLGPMYLGM